MEKKEIARAFSNGEFEKIYDLISENSEWTVIEENIFKGKQDIIDNCKKIANYFKSVTTKFETLNIIEEDNKVVINGTAEFFKDNKRISFISACDIYEFNETNLIKKITSYCISNK